MKTDKATCGAKTRSGTPCKKPPVPGRSRCHLHGGATPRGADHPNFKHGKYSKLLPDLLAARYDEAQADPQLLEQRAEIALLDVRLTELLGGINSGGKDLWKDASALYGVIAVAFVAGNATRMRDKLSELNEVIQSGISSGNAWTEIYEVVEQRRKLVESERKREVEMRQTVSITELLTMFGRIAAVARTCFGHQPDDLSRFIGELTGLISVGQSAAIPGRITQRSEPGE